MNSSDSFTLTPTGERMIPEYLGSIVSEHLHRYAIAQSRAGGLDVLDVASGEGYGSALLADVARSVIGVDIDRVTIEHARAKYVRSNLRFEVGSCTNIPLSAASVDLIVSFETIEHIVEHELFMREIRRVLRPGGLLVISCPDRRVYNETLEKGNPFHQHELYYDEFVSLIKTHFNHAAFGKQQYGEASVIFFSQSTGTMTSVEGNFEKFVSGDFEVSGAYSLAIASDVQLVLPPSSFFRLDASLRHQSPSLTACQLFASGDGIFSEEQSERYSLVLGQKTELRFQNLAKWVTGTRLHLRLDPSEVKSKIILHSITIED
ncbi:MAG TPA: methyltransferase domain-containing protein, partial [Opitutaceae bacterium]